MYENEIAQFKIKIKMMMMSRYVKVSVSYAIINFFNVELLILWLEGMYTYLEAYNIMSYYVIMQLNKCIHDNQTNKDIIYGCIFRNQTLLPLHHQSIL